MDTRSQKVGRLADIHKRAFAKLAAQIIAIKQQLASAKSDSDRKMFEQYVQILNFQTNTPVYKLYGLTKIEVFVLHDFLKEKLGIEFRSRTENEVYREN